MSTTPEKRCTKCGVVRPIEEFYRDRTKNSGRRSHCPSCMSVANRAYTPSEEQKCRYRSKARERRRTMPGLASGRARAASYYQRNRAKSLVRAATKDVIRAGRLQRGPCARADGGCSGQIEAHHLSYTAKDSHLNVVWLCTAHHVEVHKK